MKRQQVIMNSDLFFKLGIHCVKLGLTSKKSNIQPVLGKLIGMYLEGKIDDIMVSDGFLEASGEPRYRVNIDSKLKSDFENRAWENGLIKYPHLSVRAMELMITLFLDGKIKLESDE